MPYSMSKSKGYLLVHRLLTSCILSMVFSSYCISRKRGRVRNPAAVRPGFVKMTSSSGPVKLPTGFLMSMAPSFNVTLRPKQLVSCLGPTQAHDHLLAAFPGDRSFSLLWVNTKGHDCWIALRVWLLLSEAEKLRSNVAVPLCVPTSNRECFSCSKSWPDFFFFFPREMAVGMCLLSARLLF